MRYIHDLLYSRSDKTMNSLRNLTRHYAILAMGLIMALGGVSPLWAAAFNFQVSGVQTQIAGTSTDVTGSGTSANFDSNAEVGDFSIFDIIAVDDSTSATSDFADLRVTYAADNGGVGSNIMIARTTNSQGLTDTGTISVLITLSGAGSVRLRFDWFTPGSFVGGVEQAGSALITTPINYTTFDIDFNQLVRVQRSEIVNYTIENPSLLTATDNGTTVSFEDDGADSTFTDPDTAAQFLTRNAPASHNIEVGKQSSNGNALFMFEFRDPSDIVVFDNPDTQLVPEPSSLALATGALALLLLKRKRRIA